jgi:glycosyltransferase involved in cell wall biosynthesis
MNLKEKIIAKAKLADEGWGSAYSLFSSVLNHFGCKTGVEIGVAFGGHSEAILKSTSIEKLYGVDPYQHFDDYDDPMNLPQNEFDALYEFTKNRLSVFGNRFEIIRNVSSNAISIINEPIDFVYIDALHTYEGVLDDLKIWFSKVRDGGIIGGHDYGHLNFHGVKQAIYEFFNRFGWEIFQLGETVWWVEKKPIHISFIMPAYNCSKTITESIESIINGNFKQGDEIIICNDDSNDETVEILNALEVKYMDLIIINHSSNKGGGAARNTAVENSKNEIIFCLDSDNVLAHKSIPRLKEFFIHSGADVAAFQQVHYFLQSKESITHKWIYNEAFTTLADCLSQFIVPGASGNYMFSKSSWVKAGGYPEYAGALDTWGFGFRQIATGSKMIAMPNSYYYHRYGHESYWVRDSKSKGKISTAALEIILPYIDLILEDDVNFLFNTKSSWFENLENRPIRLKDYSKGKKGEVINYQLRYKKYLIIGNYLRYIKRKLSL